MPPSESDRLRINRARFAIAQLQQQSSKISVLANSRILYVVQGDIAKVGNAINDILKEAFPDADAMERFKLSKAIGFTSIISEPSFKDFAKDQRALIRKFEELVAESKDAIIAAIEKLEKRIATLDPSAAKPPEPPKTGVTKPDEKPDSPARPKSKSAVVLDDAVVIDLWFVKIKPLPIFQWVRDRFKR